MADLKTFTLPSGKVAVVAQFKGKHVRIAQERVMGGENDSIVFILISLLATIDGSAIVPEDLDEMDGADVLSLMGEFSGANFRNATNVSVPSSTGVATTVVDEV